MVCIAWLMEAIRPIGLRLATCRKISGNSCRSRPRNDTPSSLNKQARRVPFADKRNRLQPPQKGTDSLAMKPKLAPAWENLLNAVASSST